MSRVVRLRRPVLSRPAMSSVSAEPAAMDAVHPRTLKPHRVMHPPFIRAESRRISPQTGFETSTVTAGGGSSPTLRGFWKCSISSGDTGKSADQSTISSCTAGGTACGLATGVLIGISNAPFWQRKYYDHWIRSEKEFFSIVHYIERNPVIRGPGRTTCGTAQERKRCHDYGCGWRTRT